MTRHGDCSRPCRARGGSGEGELRVACFHDGWTGTRRNPDPTTESEKQSFDRPIKNSALFALLTQPRLPVFVCPWASTSGGATAVRQSRRATGHYNTAESSSSAVHSVQPMGSNRRDGTEVSTRGAPRELILALGRQAWFFLWVCQGTRTPPRRPCSVTLSFARSRV